MENVLQITKRAETFNSRSFYITIISVRNGIIMKHFNEDVISLYAYRVSCMTEINEQLTATN